MDVSNREEQAHLSLLDIITNPELAYSKITVLFGAHSRKTTLTQGELLRRSDASFVEDECGWDGRYDR